jgi:hypothetical protein
MWNKSFSCSIYGTVHNKKGQETPGLFRRLYFTSLLCSVVIVFLWNSNGKEEDILFDDTQQLNAVRVRACLQGRTNMKWRETMPNWEKRKKNEPLQFCFYSKTPWSYSLANYEIAFLSLFPLVSFVPWQKNKIQTKTRSPDEISMRILSFFLPLGQ